MRQPYKLELVNASTGAVFNQTTVTCHPNRQRHFALALIQDAIDEFGWKDLDEAGELEIRITDPDGASWGHYAFVDVQPKITLDEYLA